MCRINLKKQWRQHTWSRGRCTSDRCHGSSSSSNGPDSSTNPSSIASTDQNPVAV